MCIIAWNWQPQGAQRLLLIANRDEYYQRPALPLHWWSQHSILAGKDLQAGGTWLGVDRRGRLAALTNYRQHPMSTEPKTSRGELVVDFLTSNLSAHDFLQAKIHQVAAYQPFNLLVFDGKRAMGMESRHARMFELPVGVGSVSNADFHSPWHKQVQLEQGLRLQLQQGMTASDDWWSLLQQRDPAPDHQLPSTGIPLAMERALSSAFIAMPHYGTRASSVVSIGTDSIAFSEQCYDANGPTQHTSVSFEFSGRPVVQS